MGKLLRLGEHFRVSALDFVFYLSVILMLLVVVRHILQPISKHLFQILIGSLPCLVIVEEATYSGVWA